MTANEFAVLCSEFAVDPAIALEIEAVRDALKSRDDEAVRNALATEL